MFTIGLAVCLFVPQGARAVHVPSRHLPADRTFVAIEIPDPAALREHAGLVLQAGALRHERVRTLVRWAFDADAMPAIEERLQKLARFGAAFDRGLTLASVFPVGAAEIEKGRPPEEPWPLVIGAASKAARLRGHPALLLEILERKQELAIEQRPLADSPVMVRWVHRNHESKLGADAGKQEEGHVHDHYVSDSSVLDAYKGRTAAFSFQQGWASKPFVRELVPLVGEAIGLGERHGPRLKPRPAAVRAGWKPLINLRYRPGAMRKMIEAQKAQGPGFMIPNFAFLMAALFGVDVIDEIAASLATDGTSIEERLAIELTEGEESVFTTLRAKGPGLYEAAVHLPADAIAAVHVNVDGLRLSRLFRAFVTGNGGDEGDLQDFYLATRGLLGLAPQEIGGDRKLIDLAGLTRLTVFVVPGAAGSPVPELGYLVRTTHEAAAEGVLTQMARLLAEQSSKVDVAAAPAEVRTLGKGEDAVRYLRYADFFDGSTAVGLSFLGGGYFSAARVGEDLLVGCNPRTVRKLRKAARDGATLARTEGFAKTFPQAAGRAIEGFVDTARLAASLRKYDNFVPFLMNLTTSRGSDAEFPRLSDFKPYLGYETFLLEPDGRNWTGVHRGGTLLSPTAWTVFGYGAFVLSTLEDIVTGS